MMTEVSYLEAIDPGANLIGVLPCLPDAPGFAIPIFNAPKTNASVFTQDIDENHIVLNFLETKIPVDAVLLRVDETIKAKVGYEAIYTFINPDLTVTSGTYETLNNHLLATRYNLKAWPNLCWEVACFSNNHQEQVSTAKALINNHLGESYSFYRNQLIKKYPSIRDTSSKNSNTGVLWDKVCGRFLNEFGKQAYTNWLEQLDFNGIDGDTVALTAPTRFVRDWVKSHYAPRLKDFFKLDSPEINSVTIHLPAEASTEPVVGTQNTATNTKKPQEKTAKGNFEGSPLDERYTFDSFVVGKSNELAYAAAKRLAEANDVTFNPLFLHGGVGLGKTHLMHAIAWEVLKNQPEKKVVYVSAEKFMFEFIAALRFKDTHAFKQKFRNVDLLMVDDVQFIAHRDSTQEEFFHTFNTLIDNHCQVVITADHSPSDLEGIQERIISRLGWGLVADIHPTDFELRLGILQSKADDAVTRKAKTDPEGAKRLVVHIEILEFLARKITSNVRELEGSLNRVIAYATLVGRSITLDMTREVLQDLIRAHNRQVTVDEIQHQTAEYFNIRRTDLLSNRRTHNIVRPRQIAMYLAKEMTRNSLPEIGRHFGGRDHTTVIHSIRKIDDLLVNDASLSEDLARIRSALEE